MNVQEKTVLVVEFDASDLNSTVRLLESAGYKTITATSFEQGSSLLRSAHPNMLVTGMRLGAYNGLHLVLRGRVANPSLAAIVTTHYPDRVLADETSRMEAVHLLRPLDADSFLAEVSKLLNHSTVAGAGLNGHRPQASH